MTARDTEAAVRSALERARRLVVELEDALRELGSMPLHTDAPVLPLETGTGDVPPAQRVVVYPRKPEFGRYLRAQRERSRLTLRAAAGRLGVSFSKLQKMETGGRPRAVPVEFLHSLGRNYGVPADEMVRRATGQLAADVDAEDELGWQRA